MGVLKDYLPFLEASLDDKHRLQERQDKLEQEVEELGQKYIDLLEAQQLLSTVSDKNTEATLDYITGVINNVLGEMFDNDRRIFLEKTLYADKYPHINVQLETGDAVRRDLALQSGNGLRQVVAFLFAVCLIEIRKGRRFIMMDEVLNGVHPDAKAILQHIIEIFAENGFQFIIIEYNMPEFGRVYEVKKSGDTAQIIPKEVMYN